MKFRSFFAFLFTVLSFTAFQSTAQITAQPDFSTKAFLEELFNSGKTFESITAEADAYFEMKYPDLTPADLCLGEHRDGDYVKYQRWSAFWKDHLNSDGTLGDFTRNNSVDGLNHRGDRDAVCDDSDSPVEWTNINYTSNMGYQIDQGRTSSLAFHPSNPNTYFVGAAWGGLWKTTDGGLTHTILNDNLPLAAVASIIIDPTNPDNMLVGLSDIVWYGPTGVGVYVSHDGGSTFEATDFVWDLTDGRRIYYMDQDPSDPNSIIVATNNGLYKSTDFFETNTLVSGGNMTAVKYSHTDPNIVYAGGNEGQFYKSTDGGDNFDFVTDFGGGQVRIAVSLMDGSQCLAVTNGNSLNVSSDHAVSFSLHSLPEANMVVEFAPGSEEILNVGNFEVYQSDNFGDSFYPVTHWLGDGGLPYIHVDQRNVFVNPLVTNKVYFCNDGGVSAHNPTTHDFSNLSTDLINTQYYDIAVSQTEDQVLGGGSQDNGNIFRSNDGSWGRYAQTGDGMGQDIDPENAGLRYWSYQYGGLRRWEAGSNTNIAPPGEDGNGAWETPFKLDPSNHNRILVGYNSVYASDNNGDSWSEVGDVVTIGGDLEQLAIAPSNPDKIYASRSHILYVKEPGESSWTTIVTPETQGITDLEVDPIDENTVYISYGGYTEDGKVYRSTDSGENWENISLNLPNLPIMSLELYSNEAGGVFVGTYGAVYYLDETLTAWKKYGCLPNTSVNDIEIQYHTGKIFIGTHGRGMFEAPITLEASGVKEEVKTAGQQIFLYPNPASSSVAIRGVGGTSLDDLQFRVTDATGRQVEVSALVNNKGELVLDCSHLRQGNYFISLVDGSLNQQVLKFSKI